jgi:pimeloyl-ACP methyl ester carboxylesterase
MPSASASYGLARLRTGPGHTAIVLHGILQTREMLAPFAEMLGDAAPALNVFTYGYNHTQGLERNGRRLADAIRSEIAPGRVDLVGYSMGGLVARLAASEDVPSRIHTVVTLATPNRGSLSNAELTTLGQLGRSTFEFLTAFAPRAEGLKDLTRAAEIMSNRRKTLLGKVPSLALSADERRYASIPGLFYNQDAPGFKFGPSVKLAGLTAFFEVGRLKRTLIAMARPHDGIVTQRSNDISTSEPADWSEVHLVSAASDGRPARCHAVIDRCVENDHISIIRDADVARLAAELLLSDDWRALRSNRQELHNRVRLYPFDAE